MKLGKEIRNKKKDREQRKCRRDTEREVKLIEKWEKQS